MDANTQTQALAGQIAAGELTTKSDDLLAKAEQIKALIASLKSANADLEAKLNACGGELSDAKTQLADMDALAKAKTDLEGQVTSKDAEIARLNEALNKAQADLAAATSAKSDLEAQVADLNKQVAALRASADDGSPLGKAAVAGAVTVGAATLAKKVGNDDAEAQPAEAAAPAEVAEPVKPAAPQPPAQPTAPAAPESRTMGLVAAGAGIGAAGAGLDLTSQLQARDAEIADLKARLEATTTVLQARDAEFGIAQEQLTAAAGSEASLADLTTKHTELQAQFDDLAAANTRLATLQSQLTELQASLDGLKAEKANVDTALNSRNAEFDALSAKMSALNSDLDAARAAKAQLDDTLKARDTELNGLRAEVARVKEDGDKAVSARVAEIGVLTAGAAAAAASIKQKDNELTDAQAKISALEAQLNALQDQLNDAQAKLQAIEAEHASAPAAAVAAEAPQTQTTLEAAPPASDRAALKAAFASAALAAGVEVKPSVCPQHLSQSKGIGSVFEQRLYAAGIGTYWELANMADDEFKRILELNERQLIRMDFNEIRGDALRLANETDSVGRIWDGGTPDDFEPLEGIGKLYEKKLYDAGICTFAALAGSTVEQLAEICPGTKLRTPDYADWIAQAKRLAGL